MCACACACACVCVRVDIFIYMFNLEGCVCVCVCACACVGKRDRKRRRESVCVCARVRVRACVHVVHLLRITRDMQSICATYNWSQLARTGINVTNICHTYMSHTYDLYKSYMCVIYV